jgi:hypothetical protein
VSSSCEPRPASDGDHGDEPCETDCDDHDTDTDTNTNTNTKNADDPGECIVNCNDDDADHDAAPHDDSHDLDGDATTATPEREPKPVEPTIEETRVEQILDLTTDITIVEGEEVVEAISADGTVTEHLPAPAIDIMKEKGFATWSVEREGSIASYFSRLASS